jgi:hypothetical protein
MHISDLKTDPNNANKGTERGQQALQQSLEQYGAGRSILIDKNGYIIAGNKTAEQAGQLGINDVKVVEVDGNTLVAVKRTDLDIEDETARQMAYADNRVGQLSLEWDADQLIADAENMDIPFFTDDELNGLISAVDAEELYSQKVDVPIYEPSDTKPEVQDLYNDTKAQKLITQIRVANITEEEKDFLILAAGRHVRFNFEQIADYYSHSNFATQEAMEDNALVIVDYNKSIQNGWVRLSDRMDEQYDDENKG